MSEVDNKTKIHSKVGAAAFGGAVSVIVVWAITAFGWVVPVEVAAAITTVLSSVFGYIAKP